MHESTAPSAVKMVPPMGPKALPPIIPTKRNGVNTKGLIADRARKVSGFVSVPSARQDSRVPSQTFVQNNDAIKSAITNKEISITRTAFTCRA